MAVARNDEARTLRILAPQMGFMLNLGGGRYDYEQLSALAALGHEVRAVLPLRNRGVSTVPANISCRWIRARGIGPQLSWSAGFLLPCLDECRRFKPDLIRIHHPYYHAPLGILLSRLTGIPAVVSVLHFEELGSVSHWVDKKLLPHFDGVFTISRATVERFKEMHPGYHGALSFAYPGLTAEVAGAVATRVEDDPFFLFVGSLIPRKNIPWLLDLFEEYVSRGLPGKLLIVGTGDQRQELATMISQLGLRSRVELVGAVSERQKSELYQQATALLFPSQMEGFGFAPAEAMAAGTPVIVSDRGSLPELVIDGETGFVLPLEDSRDLWISKMELLMSNAEVRSRCGARAIAHARAHFSWQANAIATAQFLTAVVDNAKSTVGGRD